MLRRRFLFVCSTSLIALALRPPELPEVSRHLIATDAGQCSFCGCSVGGGAWSMARAVGTDARICDGCVGMAVDLLAEHGIGVDVLLPELRRIAEAERSGLGARAIDRRIATLRAHLEHRPLPLPRTRRDPPLACTFCRGTPSDDRRLVAGPTVYVCAGCVAEGFVETERIAAWPARALRVSRALPSGEGPRPLRG